MFCPNEHLNLCEEERVQLTWDNWMIPFIRYCQKPYTHLAKAHLGILLFSSCNQNI